MKYHIRNGFEVVCAVEGCARKYQVISSFTSHLSRCHYVPVNEKIHQSDPCLEEGSSHFCDVQQ